MVKDEKFNNSTTQQFNYLKMAAPKVTFIINASNLGGANPTNNGIAGLIIQAPATDKLALSTPTAVYSLADAIALGLTADFDEANKVSAYAEVEDFYSKTGGSGELWLMLVSQDTSLEDICDQANDIAKKLLLGSGRRVRVWGVAANRPEDYEPATAEGIDGDVFAAMLKVQGLCEALALSYYMPTRCILPGRAFSGDVSKLRDLKQGSCHRAAILLHGRKGAAEARVGFMLGVLASIPVQRNVGRVASGDLKVTEAYLTDGVTLVDDIVEKYDVLCDKGYIFPQTYAGKSGYFYDDDPTACSNTNDFSTLCNGRVMDKVVRLAYEVYVEFLKDDYAFEANGQMGAAVLKSLQGSIEDVVGAAMVATGELSNFACTVDPTQASGNTQVVLSAQPRGYHKAIEVVVGFVKSIE